MPLQRWALPTSLPDVPAVTRTLRVLQGLLGRTPLFADARIITASTTITDADDTLLVATAGGAVTVTLPVASTVLGRRYTVKKTDASANNVVLDGNGSETIDGAANITWNVQWTAYTVQAVLTASPATFNWVLVSKGLL